MPYPPKISQKEALANQRKLYSMAARIEKRMAYKAMLDLEIDPFSVKYELKAQAMKVEMDAKMDAAIEQEERAIYPIYAIYETGATYGTSTVYYVRNSYPLMLMLTPTLENALNAELYSSARAEVVRAEIMKEPSGGTVELCVMFRRNGSAFVDKFNMALNKIFNMGGLSSEQYKNLTGSEPKFAPIPTNSAVKDLSDMYNKAVVERILGPPAMWWNTGWDTVAVNPVPEPVAPKKNRMIEL